MPNTYLEINQIVKPVVTFNDYHEGHTFQEKLNQMGIKLELTEIGLSTCGEYVFIVHKKGTLKSAQIKAILEESNIEIPEYNNQ